MDFLIPPHGGALCRQLLAEPSSVERLKEEARATRAVVLSPRRISDLDLLFNSLIPEFTGISDPCEVPEHPEIRLDTANLARSPRRHMRFFCICCGRSIWIHSPAPLV
jgi:hypothetical protein